MLREPLTFNNFEEVARHVQLLHQHGYDRTGNWDLAQILNHLGYFMKGGLEGYTFKVPWIIKALFGKMVKNRMLREQKMKAGGFTPQKPLPPPNADEAQAVAEFLALLDRFDKHQGEFCESPFFGKLTRDESRQMNLIHCGHHLSFLLPKG
jgi:hypothetical protein